MAHKLRIREPSLSQLYTYCFNTLSLFKISVPTVLQMPITTFSPNHGSFARSGLPFPSLLATCYHNRSAGWAAS